MSVIYLRTLVDQCVGDVFAYLTIMIISAGNVMRFVTFVLQYRQRDVRLMASFPGQRG